MNLKDKLTQKWRALILVTSVAVLSSGNLSAQEHSSSHDRQTAPKAYFSPKKLASALTEINADQEKCDRFLDFYLQKVDCNGRITPSELIEVFSQTGLSKEEALTISGVLLDKKDHPAGSKTQGYDFGSYNVSFAIDEHGDLSQMHFQGDRKISDAEIDRVHHARCRHKGLAVDKAETRFQSSLLIDKMLIRDIVIKKQQSAEKVPNGDKFLQKFAMELHQEGLEIGKDGKLHGIEASRNKPLLTENDLYQQFLNNHRMEMMSLKRN